MFLLACYYISTLITPFNSFSESSSPIRASTPNATPYNLSTAFPLLDIRATVLFFLFLRLVKSSVLWLVLRFVIILLRSTIWAIRLVFWLRLPRLPFPTMSFRYQSRSPSVFISDLLVLQWFFITTYSTLLLLLILYYYPFTILNLPLNSVGLLVVWLLQLLIAYILIQCHRSSLYIPGSSHLSPSRTPIRNSSSQETAGVSYVSVREQKASWEDNEPVYEDGFEADTEDWYEDELSDIDFEEIELGLPDSDYAVESNPVALDYWDSYEWDGYDPSSQANWDIDPNLQFESGHDIQLAAEYLNPNNDDYEPYPNNEDVVNVYTAYKRVDKKVRPIAGHFPQSAQVRRTIPSDPLLTLPPLSKNPPPFEPTKHLTQERMDGIKINPEGYLSEQEERLFMQVLLNNEQSLAFGEEDRGTLKESYFSPYIMPTVEHTPWQIKHRPIAHGIRNQVIELLKDKIKAGVYEPSQSSYRSSWFCVRKKTANSLRIVHDLQPLNEVSIKDAGVPPKLDDFVEPFAGAQCYTVFDLFCGFDARKLALESRDLTTFLTPLGPMRLTSMPMGYTNSPAEFQQSMVFIIQPEIPDTANIFIDDLPIKGPKTQYLDGQGKPEVLPDNPGIRRFIWEHAVDVNRVMHRIKESGATFSAKKIQMCKPEVVIIGQKCTPEGRLPEDDKVAKILNWPPLKTPKDARGFLGLCGGVRIWIKDYSLLARPLTELWRKDVEFEWTPRRQEAFNTLKNLISSAPALRPIDYDSDLPVMLSVDSSYIAVGFILSQMDEAGKRRPARYGSIPMNEREARYSQPKLELYGLFRALRAYRMHLIGVKNLVVEVDAKYIKGMLSEPDMQPNAAMNRWIQGILMFDFKLVHVPAEKHVGPDALSRRELGEGEVIEEEDDEWLDDVALHTRILESEKEPVRVLYSGKSKEDNLLEDIFKFLTTLQAPYNPDPQSQQRFIRKAQQYFVDDERYMWTARNGKPLKVIMDRSRRMRILKQAHEGLGHRGVKAVYELVRERFHWPHMWASIKSHVATCHECQIRNTKKIELPLTVSTPVSLFSKVYIDVMNMPEVSGYKYIVAARDDLSRASEGKALKKNNSQELADFFWEHIYCRYGAVQHVVTDNGPEMKKAFKLVLDRLKIPQIKISAYNSKANGVVERGHFTIREALIKSCKGDLTLWPSKVQTAFFADRVSISAVTGFSAYFLLHGTHPILPFDLTEATFLVSGFKAGMSSVDLLALRIRQLEKRPEDIAKAAQRLREARFRSKEHFERKFKKKLSNRMYRRGELVLIQNKRIEKELNRKHKPRYLGPFEVLRRTKGGSYVLKQLDGPILRQGVGAFRMYPYLERDVRGLRKLVMDDTDIDSDPESDPASDSD